MGTDPFITEWNKWVLKDALPVRAGTGGKAWFEACCCPRLSPPKSSLCCCTTAALDLQGAPASLTISAFDACPPFSLQALTLNEAFLGHEQTVVSVSAVAAVPARTV